MLQDQEMADVLCFLVALMPLALVPHLGIRKWLTFPILYSLVTLMSLALVPRLRIESLPHVKC